MTAGPNGGGVVGDAEPDSDRPAGIFGASGLVLGEWMAGIGLAPEEADPAADAASGNPPANTNPPSAAATERRNTILPFRVFPVGVIERGARSLDDQIRMARPD